MRTNGVAPLIVTGLAIALGIALVAHNASRHEWSIGYDAGAHLDYARTLARGRLPGPDDTYEFFAAPLGYVVPAIACRFSEEAETIAEAWQWANVGFAAVLFTVLAIFVGDVASGRFKAWAAATAIGLLATMPVLPRTFAMARPEPLLAMLTAVLLVLTTRLARRPGASPWRWAIVGLVAGLMPLTRQWGGPTAVALCLVPAAAAIRALPWRDAWRRIGIGLAVAVIVAGPFYLSLAVRFGSPLTFNREAATQAHETERGELSNLWRAPIRSNLSGYPAAIVYADWWGDYWLYYHVFAKDDRGNFRRGSTATAGRLPEERRRGGNVDEAAGYLGRVAVVSLAPTAACLAGLAWATWVDVRRWPTSPALLGLSAGVILTALGFAWVVLRYDDGSNDVAKATYLSHLALPLAAAGALLLDRIADHHPRVALALLLLLALAAAHNTDALFTNYA